MSSLLPEPMPIRDSRFARAFPGQHPSLNMPRETNIVPIITPFDTSGKPIVDTAVLNIYLDHLIKMGNTHLFVLGETGEFRFIPVQDRLAFAHVLIPLAEKKGLKCFLNVTCVNLSDSLSHYREACQIPGLQAVIFAPLWGNNAAVFERLRSGYFDEGPPVILYNNPGITDKQNIGEAELRSVAGKIAALKDSAGDSGLFRRYRAALNDGSGVSPLLYMGDEFLAPRYRIEVSELSMPSDMDGAVGSSGNVSNHLARLFSPDFFEVDNVESLEAGLRSAVLAISEHRTKMVGGLKEVLRAQQIIPFAQLHRDNPCQALSDPTKRIIAAFVEQQAEWLQAP